MGPDLPALLWSRVADGFTQVAPPAAGILELSLTLLAVAVVTGIPVTWRLFALFVTLVHELGHTFAGIMTGRIVTGIKLSFDHSGITKSYGRLGGLGEVWFTFWGYPVPAVVGGALVWAGLSGWAPAALSTGSIILLLAVLGMRNWAGLAITLGSAVVAVSLLCFAPTDVLGLITVGLGMALLVGAVRDWWKVLSAHTGEPADLKSSDAYSLFRSTGIPSPIWLGLFAVPIMAGWLLAAASVIPVAVAVTTV